MRLIPNSYGAESALQEFNPCHNPAGSPAGGQFCSQGAGMGGGRHVPFGWKAGRSLADWEKTSKYRAKRMPGGGVVVPQVDPNSNELWRLSDYTVSSVSGGSVWLTPNSAEMVKRRRGAVSPELGSTLRVAKQGGGMSREERDREYEAQQKTPRVQRVSATETSKILRGDLKRAFPGVKFSVRSSYYSMGSSVDVKWTDGPLESEVRTLLNRFGGKGFDGMTDSSYYNPGTPRPDGMVYQSSASLSASRSLSPALKKRIEDYVDRQWGWTVNKPTAWESIQRRDMEIHQLSRRAKLVKGNLFILKD